VGSQHVSDQSRWTFLTQEVQVLELLVSANASLGVLRCKSYFGTVVGRKYAIAGC
jgi:hypothetical protein